MSKRGDHPSKRVGDMKTLSPGRSTQAKETKESQRCWAMKKKGDNVTRRVDHHIRPVGHVNNFKIYSKSNGIQFKD